VCVWGGGRMHDVHREIVSSVAADCSTFILNIGFTYSEMRGGGGGVSCPFSSSSSFAAAPLTSERRWQGNKIVSQRPFKKRRHRPTDATPAVLAAAHAQRCHGLRVSSQLPRHPLLCNTRRFPLPTALMAASPAPPCASYTTSSRKLVASTPPPRHSLPVLQPPPAPPAPPRHSPAPPAPRSSFFLLHKCPVCQWCQCRERSAALSGGLERASERTLPASCCC
jgi:hypothetical protein